MPAHRTLTREQLYELARRAGIEGRSRMGKQQLMLALDERPSPSRPVRKARSKAAERLRDAPVEKAAPARSPTSGRPVWRGTITFGLISIPVGLFSATEERDIGFHLLSAADGARVRYKRVSAASGQEVPSDGIVRGYEYEKGRYVVFTDEELERIPSDSLRAIEVVQFARADEIDPIYFDTPYYLGPEKAGLKAYRLLLRALQEAGRVAVAKVTLREKERLCTLRVADGVLVLETLRWPDEIRVPAFAGLEEAPDASAREVDLAVRLIDGMTDPFVPEQFRDSYREHLEEAIKAKVEGRQVQLAAEPREPAPVTDLMTALRRSVEATRLRKSA